MRIVHRIQTSLLFPLLAGGAALLLAAGCGGAREAGDREPFVIESEPEEAVGLSLAAADSSVKSVQLYRVTERSGGGIPDETGSEVQFPALALGSIDQLELEFDLMEAAGRPLSVYFYHADANWRRDLTPAEYLGAFHRDELVSYTPSRATDVAYTHYAYRFPNSAISFLISGNYVLRVTEQGMEEEVLFERPFFVTEQAVGLQVGIENRLMGERGFNAVQPSASFVPPAAQQPNVYDFSVCFVRNGRFEAPRCAAQPRLIQSPSLLFYLEPRQAFEPVTADYFLDLRYLRVGNQIARVDFGAVPYRVVLEPDYARFPGNPIAPFLRGQTVISGAVTDVANPDVSAQYALVQFCYVTDTGRRFSL